MNAWGFFASTIGSLAWPVLLAILFFLFRVQIRALATKLAVIQYKDLRVVFDQTLGRVEKEVSLELAAKGSRFISRSEPRENDRFYYLADQSPSAAITLKWLDVEKALKALARQHGLVPSERRSTLFLIKLLRSQGRIDAKTEQILRDLRNLRNLAMQPSDGEIQKEEAVRFGELADEVIELLRQSAA